MFYFLLFIIILVMTYLFYIKFFKKVESFTFEGYNPYADDKAMLVDIVDNYYYYKKPVVFEHNNHTCVFSQSNPIEKQFKRVVLPDNYNEISELNEYENVDSAIHKNDRHITTTDDKYNTVLNFQYDPTLDLSSNNADKSYLANYDTSYNYNYENLQNYNSNNVSSSYIENYKICNGSIPSQTAIDEIDSNDAADYLDKILPCAYMKCDNSLSDEELIDDAYQSLATQIIESNEGKIDNILYSSGFLGWLKRLKQSNEELSNLQI